MAQVPVASTMVSTVNVVGTGVLPDALATWASAKARAKTKSLTHRRPTSPILSHLARRPEGAVDHRLGRRPVRGREGLDQVALASNKHRPGVGELTEAVDPMVA